MTYPSLTNVGGGNDIIYDKILGELPPESTKFEWPLYINLPFEEEYDRTTDVLYVYVKRDDIIIQQLANWLGGNKVLISSSGWGTDYDAYPPELYINGIRITKCNQFVFSFNDVGEDWVLYTARPEHLGDCQTECSLNIDGSYIYLRITIPK